MRLPDPSLEPAVRDPKKLRSTAICLVIIMLFGGWLILKAYDRRTSQEAGDDRPAIVYRITPERDLRMLRQDGRIVDLVSLRGKVVAINVISLRDPELARLSLAVMERLSQQRAADPNFVLVTLIVDPIPSEKLISTLNNTAITDHMKLPKWIIGSNEPGTLHKFIKNELKTNIFPYEKDGKWLYDSEITLLDKNGHIRRGVVPQKRGGEPYIATFDFNDAAKWDEKGVKTGTEHTNTEQLEILLNHTIDKLLAEPAQN
jgi:cytochrome oxidase Cu insertion factor (SCO1/SenC/PrrC family)